MFRKIALIFLLFCSFCACAQINTMGQNLQMRFQYEVHDIAQFIDRFNFLPTDKKENIIAVNRKENLAMLCDLSDNELLSSSEVKDFANMYTADSIHSRLNYDDSNWEAIVYATFKNKNDVVKIDIVLGMYVDDQGSSWVIKNVVYKEPVLQECSNPSAKINPVNNEVEFSELWKALTWKQNVSCFAHNFKPDMMTLFFYQLQQKIITFQKFESIEYKFRTGLGYTFFVKKFNRPSNNSGWLIYKLIKT